MHSLAMRAALCRADTNDGWLATPEIPADYRGPIAQPYDSLGVPGRDRSLLGRLQFIVDQHGSSIASVDAAGNMTFHALWSLTARIARIIAPASVVGPIGILLPGGGAYLAAVLACLAAGRVSVLLDPGLPRDRVLELIALTGARMVLTDETGVADWAPVPAWVVPRQIAETGADQADIAMPAASGWLGQDAPAFIICTSGSTGRPKAIVRSQRGMYHGLQNLLDTLHLGVGDRVLTISSAAVSGGMFALFSALSGASVQSLSVTDGGLRRIATVLRDRAVTVVMTVPSVLRAIAELPDARAIMAGLRCINVYGEPLLKADVAVLAGLAAPHCMILNGYGATEVPGALTWYATTADDQHPVLAPAGLLSPGTEAKIIDDTGHACPAGEIGELVLRSRFTALGELEEGRLVPGRLLPDPADPALRIYLTGDLARWAADGTFVILGRKDRMLKINGQRVELTEIEAVLRRSADVTQAAVIPRADGTHITLLAFVVAVPGAEDGLAARLRAMLRAALPAFMVPSRIEILPALPLLPGGKVDAHALLARDGQRSLMPPGDMHCR